MEAYQQRVVDEKKELDDKLSKLNSFTGTDTFSKLGEEDTILLLAQMRVMQQYSDILGARLKLFINQAL